VEVQHQGSQAIASLAGQHSRTTFAENELEYSNRFAAVIADAQFRPERVSSKPRFYGALNATVDASGDGQYAEIDDQGRYKIVLPFDRGNNSGGRASRWIRMAQPYAGNDFGMHFPLHKGTEVLISFIDGDPDRPIISGAAPNPDNASPIKASNQTQAMIRTGGGNQIKFEDNAGSQLIRMDSPTSNSYFRIGATNSNPPGIDIGSDGQMTTTVGGHVVTKIGQDYTCKIGGRQHKVTTGEVQYEFNSNSHKIVRGNAKEEVYGNKDTQTIGNATEKTQGNKLSKVSGSTDETYVGSKTSRSLASTSEVYAGAKQALCLAAVNENFAGVKASFCASINLEETGGIDLSKASNKKMHADQNIELKCGASQINLTPSSIEFKCGSSKMTLTSGGDIIVKGNRFDVSPQSNMQVHCGGTKFKITGSSFFVNTSTVDIKGKVNQG
jgi:type VI secretion system secreted protein VgrG